MRYPLLQAQMSIFLDSQHAPDSVQYNLPCVTPLDGRVDLQRLEQALQRIVACRPILKTRFELVDGEVRQWMDTSMSIPVDRIRLADDQLYVYVHDVFLRPFDVLSGEPLVRFVIVETEVRPYLLTDCYHILMDGMSIASLLLGRDLTAAYEGGTLPESDYGMMEAAEDEAKSFTTPRYEEDRAWQHALMAGREFASFSDVPAGDRPSRVWLMTEQMDRAACDSWCKMHHVVPSTLFQAAFALVLSRFTRSESVAYTTVWHGRGDRRLRAEYGMFVRMVPTVSELTPETTPVDLMHRSLRNLAAFRSHSTYPFTHLCEEMKLVPSDCFNFMGVSALEEVVVLEGNRYPIRQYFVQDSTVGLNVYVTADAQTYEIRVLSSEHRNPPGAVKRIARAVRATVENMMAHPEAPLSEISTVTEAEKAELIALGTGERLDYDRSETLVDLFRRNAKARPDSLAVVAANGTLTYGELDAQSDALAAALVEKGVKPNDFVVMKLGRVKEVPLAILGIWKAGAAYVPVDPEYPEERIRYMIEDSGARVVVDEAFVEKAKGQGEGEQWREAKCHGEGERRKGSDFVVASPAEKNDHLCSPSPSTFASSSPSPSTFTSRATPASLAYMIYTSGSTGLPKGVMVTHANIMSFTQWLLKVTEAKPGEALAHFSSFSFDGSLDDLVTMFGSGATLHILDEATRRDMTAFHDYLVKNKIVVMDLPAAYAMSLLNTYDDIPLRFLSTGGEKLLATKYLPKRFVNGYGPTEFAVCSSIHDVDPEHDGDDIPIGRPVPNTLSAIVDAEGNLLPRGAVGELVLAGDQLSRGYWRRPELTQEKFVALPWMKKEGQRSKVKGQEEGQRSKVKGQEEGQRSKVKGQTEVDHLCLTSDLGPLTSSQTSDLGPLTSTPQLAYRTGDLARWNENGELMFCGRIDNQVKLRGFRIELGEIETAMAKFPGVTAAVADVKKVNGLERLVGYYVEEGQRSKVKGQEEGQRSKVKGQTEESNHLCLTSDLGPLTSSSTSDLGPLTSSVSALKNHLERQLTAYMIPDAFVRLDSLPMTPAGKVDRKALPLPEIVADEIVAPSTDRERQLFAVVADELKTEAFGVTTNLITMGLSSLRAIRLSAAINRRMGIVISTGEILSHPRIRDWGESKETGVKIPVLPPRETYSLTPNQLGLYIEWERNPAGLEYDFPAALKFTNVDAEKLREAVAKAVAAHPYLKTHFENRNGTIVQVRRDEAEFAIPLERLESAPDAAFFSARIHPFDLLKEDLARIEVFGCGNDSWLFCEIHHILYDGSSAGVFIQAILEALAGAAPQPERASALDYALFLEGWAKSAAHDESLRHYAELLEGTESFRYPSRRGDAEASGAGASRIFRIARPAIRARCRQLGITENAFFATVFSQVFHRAARTDRVQIATISGGRSPEQLSNTVGMFVQTMPLVSKSPKGKAAEILRTMQDQIAAILQNDLVSYAELAEKFSLSADVLYVYQDGIEGSMEGLPDFVRLVEGLTLAATQRGMTVGVSPASDGEFEIHIDYDGGLYAEDEMRALEHAVAAFAQNLAAASDVDEISAIPLVTEAEAHDLVALGTGETLEYNADETFLDLFRRQVKEHPDATAVIASNGTFTYGELDAASDALAAALVGKGVKPGDFVAVKLPRIREFPAAVIAAWKVGAAYVPVDPAAAPDRVAYMLEDSGARVVVDEAFVEKAKGQGEGEQRCASVKAKCHGEGERRKGSDFVVVSPAEKNDHLCSPSPSTFASSSPSTFASSSPSSSAFASRATPASLAYMIYTSGSTGKPKGVMVSHRALRAFIAWRTRLTGSTVGDCDGINASFSFDASMDIYATLASGATAYIFDDILKPDLDRILAQIRKHGIRVMGMNTSLGVAFLDNYDVPLNLLTLGGEALTPFRPCKTRVANCYGPTEFTVASVIGIVDQTFPDGTNISIGRPVPNSVCAIVDAYGNLLPRGMAGELCSAGVQIAEGYWGREELTQEKFVALPWQKKIGQRSKVKGLQEGQRSEVKGQTVESVQFSLTSDLGPLTSSPQLAYRTGDLACWNSRGEVLYLGRMDAQVKFRGYRIELGEIEANVLAFPGIREAAVCVKKVGAADRLCCYYVEEGQRSKVKGQEEGQRSKVKGQEEGQRSKVKGQEEGQRSKVKGQTEESNHLCLTSDLGPLTSSQTSDLGPLTSSQTSDLGPLTSSVDEAALRTALSKSLADYMVPDCFIRLDAIPRNLSGKVDHRALPAPVVEKGEIVPPETDFEKKVFDVVAAELGDADFGVTTNLIMLGLTSIRALRLSSAIRKATGREIRIGDILSRPRIRDWDAVRSESETIAVLPPRESYPLLPNQLELFRAWQGHPTRLQWNLPTALRLDGVDAEKLRDAVEKTIAAHPYLKVHLEERDGGVVQVRRDAAELPVLFRRLDSAPDAAFFQSRVRPFDLLHEGLARFEVYGFGADAYLFYDVHHIIFDGGSVGVFQSDLFRAYAGEEILLEAVTAYDYALAYGNWLKGAAHDEAGKYFEELIGDTKSFCLPSAARVDSEGRVGGHLAELPRAAIVAWCRARGVTENAFFATAFCEALRRTAGVDDVQIAMISNGRSLAQQEGMVGMFVETLPLVSRKPGGTAEETVRAMQHQIAESVRRDRYPYAELAARQGVKANVSYAYQGGLLDFAQPGPKVTNIPLRLDMVKNPLSLDVFPTADTYALCFEYDAGLYAEDEIRRLAQTLSDVARVNLRTDHKNWPL